MNLVPEQILREVERRRVSFPDLKHVREIWFIETIFYRTAFGGTYLRFELYEAGNVAGSYDFADGTLLCKVERAGGEAIRGT